MGDKLIWQSRSGQHNVAPMQAGTSTTTQDVSAETLETPAQKAEQEPSIAVLPFINMSADPEQEYFSDGISEEILQHSAGAC